MEKKEYIERETAIKAALNGIRGQGVTSITAIHMVEKLENVPAADVVEVVRCKDCKNYNDHRYCYYHADPVVDDDFCSYGERREA